MNKAVASSRATVPSVTASASLRFPPTSSINRRQLVVNIVLSTSLITLMKSSEAEAKDLKEAQAEKEARKKALREAAGEIARSGKDVEGGVFAMPEFSVSEEARTPNMHSRQGEGAKQQKNA
jgi:hypothetical protein